MMFDPETITRQLRNALLLRGFPCFQDYLNIYLAPGFMDEDFAELNRLIRPHALHKRIQGLVDNQPPIQIQDHNRTTLYRLHSNSAELFLHRFPRILRESREISYLTSPDGWGNKGSKLSGFLETKFGSRVPVTHLEHGVALLVKVLPWYGVRTSMSCAGHLRDNGGHTAAKVFFYGHFHGAWCQHIFESLFSEHEIARHWQFDLGPVHADKCRGGVDPNWASASFQAAPDWLPETENPRREHRRSLERLHQIARQLMNPSLANHFRAKKNDWILDYNQRFIEAQSELDFSTSPDPGHRIAS